MSSLLILDPSQFSFYLAALAPIVALVAAAGWLATR